MAEVRTEAGQALVAWMDSDMRPLQEFGYDTIADAVEAIERQAAVDECGATRSIQNGTRLTVDRCINRVGHNGRHGPWRTSTHPAASER